MRQEFTDACTSYILNLAIHTPEREKAIEAELTFLFTLPKLAISQEAQLLILLLLNLRKHF
ncbi:MAG: hypothetical protein AVDCRST_MAG96-1586 [uncultured Segetibacter sp.]|uniref:Uncharacterized protein n=1 Tax=uncultured Segetibacter sp. TaxID=481133 RepID=A0A6J4S8W3_9BACT|nr:MAG: hypothetical protein AVDCRST_MAG96-1586 [uncultured Segetibacter sp.]